MQLPPDLQQALEQELAGCDLAQLRAASARLSTVYRDARERTANTVHLAAGPHPSAVSECGTRAFANAADRAAYLAVRMPATFAAVSAALGWTREACVSAEPDKRNPLEIRSLLDLGSGPGTALWAAAQHFPELERCAAVERDGEFVAIGRRLAAHSESKAVRETKWLCADLSAKFPGGEWDLAICSYALNELSEGARAELIRRAWRRCAKLLLIVEPGTRVGFANILHVREQMLRESPKRAGDQAAAAQKVEDHRPMLAAPCPHVLACPMAAAGDWCHFAARVERTALHRRMKDATLGHEDEKFSYIAFAREGAWPPQTRIVRRPRTFSGYAQLTLCSEGNLAETTVTRSQKDSWRRLKRLGWGDAWHTVTRP